MIIRHLIFFSGPNAASEPDGGASEVCIANISSLEQQKRLMFAIRQFIITLLILGVLIALNLNPLWRLPLFFLFSASTVSFFQVLDKT